MHDDHSTSPLDNQIPWPTLLTKPGSLNPTILSHPYPGSGTDDDPYQISFLPELDSATNPTSDPADPMRFPAWLRWTLCLSAAWTTFSVAFISSAYVGGVSGIAEEFGRPAQEVMWGVSLFLVGFVVGPLVWAPLSGMIFPPLFIPIPIPIYHLYWHGRGCE